MLFPTVAFAVFFLIAFLANWLLRPTFRIWLVVMTAMSFVFYGWADPRFTLLLGASAVVNWAFGEAVARSRAAPQAWVRAAVAVNLVFLGIFKYFDFFTESVIEVLDRVGIDLAPPVVTIALPVGISFFTFHAISYVIDIGRGTIRPMPLGDFCLYLSFFPHLVAGPIVRASEFGPQIRRRPDPRDIPAAEALRLIAAGLFKKVVISSFVATELVDPVFGAPRPTASSTSSSPSTPTPSRSTPTSPATPTSPSAAPCCSASGSPRTSTRRTGPCRSRTSGGAGT